MMKVYVIIKNNEEEYEDYFEWIEEIYSNKEKAKIRFKELVVTNKYKRDRRVDVNKHIKATREKRINVGAYRLEEHEVLK